MTISTFLFYLLLAVEENIWWLAEKAQPRQWRWFTNQGKNHLDLVNIAADTAFSSGENYHDLEQEHVNGWIPVHGQFKNEREGFTYNEKEDCFVCRNDKKVVYKKTFIDKEGRQLKRYTTTRKDCKDCPFKVECIGKQPEKKFDITYYYKEYQRAYQRQNSRTGRYMKKKRQSTVEPVFGTLINFLGLKKINVRDKPEHIR